MSNYTRNIELKIWFGEDQREVVERILKDDVLSNYIVDYSSRKGIGKDTDVMFIIKFRSSYGIYLFGHMQAKNDLFKKLM